MTEAEARPSGAERAGGQIELTVAEIEALAPDQVLVFRATAWTDAERDAARSAIPVASQIAFFSFDADGFRMRDAVAAALRLQALIEPLSRALEGRAGSPRSFSAPVRSAPRNLPP